MAKRYIHAGEPGCGMEEDDLGGWVRIEDFEAQLAARDKAWTEMRANISTVAMDKTDLIQRMCLAIVDSHAPKET